MTAPVRRLHLQKSVEKFKNFLGLSNVYCELVSGNGRMPSRLTQNLRIIERKTFDKLSENELKDLNTLKEILMSGPVSVLPGARDD